MQPRILVADDQADILSALKLLLKREGFDVATATSPAGALDIAAREHVDVALVDLNYSRDTTSGEEGVALVGELHRQHPDLPVVVMTAWATVEVAVQAMQRRRQRLPREALEQPAAAVGAAQPGASSPRRAGAAGASRTRTRSCARPTAPT